jgi:hypothetical protein
LSFRICAHTLVRLHVLRLHFVKDPLRNHWARLVADRLVPLILSDN